MKKSNWLKVGAGLTVASVFPLAASAAVDTTAIIAVITDASAAAATIGVAVLSMHYGIKLYKWMKGAG